MLMRGSEMGLRAAWGAMVVGLGVCSIGHEGWAAGAGDAVQTVRVVATEFKYIPSTVVVPAGQPVEIVLDTGQAATEHRFSVPELGLRVDAAAGEFRSKRFTFKKPGEYTVVCDLPGHEEAGMFGRLVVTTQTAGRPADTR